MIIRLYELIEANDGLGGVSEERTLIHETNRGKVSKKELHDRNTEYLNDDLIYEVIIPKNIQLEKNKRYEIEIEEG